MKDYIFSSPTFVRLDSCVGNIRPRKAPGSDLKFRPGTLKFNAARFQSGHRYGESPKRSPKPIKQIKPTFATSDFLSHLCLTAPLAFGQDLVSE